MYAFKHSNLNLITHNQTVKAVNLCFCKLIKKIKNNENWLQITVIMTIRSYTKLLFAQSK